MGTARERECGSGDWPEREEEGEERGSKERKHDRGVRESPGHIPACTWSVSNLCVEGYMRRHGYEQERGREGH